MSEVLKNNEAVSGTWADLEKMADKFDDSPTAESGANALSGEADRKPLSFEELEDKYSRGRKFGSYEAQIYHDNPLLLERMLEMGAQSGVDFQNLIKDTATRMSFMERGIEPLFDDDLEHEHDDWYIGAHGEALERFSDQTLVGLGRMFQNLDKLADDQIFILNRSEEDMSKILDNYSIMHQALQDKDNNIDQKPRGGFLERIQARLQQLRRKSHAEINHEQYDFAAKRFQASLLEDMDFAKVDSDALRELSLKAKKMLTREAQADRHMWDSTYVSDSIRIHRDEENPLENASHLIDAIEEVRAKDTLPVRQEQEIFILKRIDQQRGIIAQDMNYLKERVFPIIEGCERDSLDEIEMLFNYSLSSWRSCPVDTEAQTELTQTADQDYALTNYLVDQIMPCLDELGALDVGGRDNSEAARSTPPRIDQTKAKTKLNLAKFAVTHYQDNADELKEHFEQIRDEFFPLIDMCSTTSGCNAVSGELTRHLGGRVNMNIPEDVEAETRHIKEYIIPLLDTNEHANIWELKRRLVDFAGKNTKLLKYFQDELFVNMNQDEERYDQMSELGLGLRGGPQVLDFEINCMVQEVDPCNINLLMNLRNNLAVRNLNKLSQNRIDSLAIERIVIDDHSFIHDQLPMTHQILQSMVDYYDAQGTPDFDMAELKLNEVIASTVGVRDGRGYGNLADKAFDLKNYDHMITGEVVDDSHIEFYNEKAIDILRRLAENTDSSKIELPETRDQNLRQLIEQASPYYDREHDTLHVDWNGAGRLVNYLNVQLISSQHRFGLDSNKVEILNFGNQVATLAMRGISENERRELSFDPVFKEFVRFQELTASFDKYDHEKFEMFYERFSNVNYEDGLDVLEHFRILQHHILEQTNKLARHYNRTKVPSFSSSVAQPASKFVMQLLSGNLGHELIGLTDPRSGRNNLREYVDQQLGNMGAF